MSKVFNKPDPTVNPLTESFWQKTSEHILQLQQCNDCQRAIFYPRRHCPHCWSETLSTVHSAGRGTIASIVEVHRAGHPAYQEDAPYYVALIDLDEGVRLLSNVSDPDGRPGPIGATVELAWRNQNGFTLPVFAVSSHLKTEKQYESQ